MNDKLNIVPLTDKNKFPKRNRHNTLRINLEHKDLERKRQKLKYIKKAV